MYATRVVHSATTVAMTRRAKKPIPADLFPGGSLVLTDAERKKQVGVTIAHVRVFGIFKDMVETASPGEDPVHPGVDNAYFSGRPR
jgi:hypothetical protein